EGIEVLGVVTHSGDGNHQADVVAAHAMPGTTASVIFTATEPGEYEFFCTIPGHKEAGMVGRLIVTDLS
ncbi:MAG: multicopper oxidase domain-containing protein, partial [Proteobacteria bacterium]|nr:multicopper oxidase domain-containing protein [Pseudomonadota bacterium]